MPISQAIYFVSIDNSLDRCHRSTIVYAWYYLVCIWKGGIQAVGRAHRADWYASHTLHLQYRNIVCVIEICVERQGIEAGWCRVAAGA